MSFSGSNIQDVEDWGSNTIQACKDIDSASKNNIDILRHHGDIDVNTSSHMRTISNLCAKKDIDLVVYGHTDPGVVYTHVTVVEEDL